jgi:cytochrome c oxidase subunit 1
MLYNLVDSLRNGKPASANPWGGLSLEWETQSPPVTENFVHRPIVKNGPYDYGGASS